MNAACGAFENVKTYSTKNISNTLKNFALEDWWTIGLDHDASTNINSIIQKMKKSDKLIFVFGSESKGIRRLIKKNCNFIASIPNMPNTQSINVSNAAAIVFYENYSLKKTKYYRSKYIKLFFIDLLARAINLPVLDDLLLYFKFFLLKLIISPPEAFKIACPAAISHLLMLENLG